MSTLYLIRHGQASFGADNYDVLSDVGVRQAKALGSHLARTSQAFDAIYTGPLQRQRDTTRHMSDAASAAGTHYPTPNVSDAFSEYPAIELIRHWLPRLREQDEQVRTLLADAAPNDLASKNFERVFHLIINRWVTGDLEVDGLESFPSFVNRVEAGLELVMRTEGRGRKVAVVTSGGPILLGVRRALGLADLVAMKLGWVIANSSVTEFRWRDDELTLVGFNRVPHVLDPTLLTYR